MTDATQTAVLQWLVAGLVTILLGIVGFAAKRWFDHIDSLQVSMDQLRESILGLSDKFVTQVQHEKDMETLRLFGRRNTDNFCPSDSCPYEKTNPGDVLLTGSGAKNLKSLIEAARRSKEEAGE